MVLAGKEAADALIAAAAAAVAGAVGSLDEAELSLGAGVGLSAANLTGSSDPNSRSAPAPPRSQAPIILPYKDVLIPAAAEDSLSAFNAAGKSSASSSSFDTGLLAGAVGAFRGGGSGVMDILGLGGGELTVCHTCQCHHKAKRHITNEPRAWRRGTRGTRGRAAAAATTEAAAGGPQAMPRPPCPLAGVAAAAPRQPVPHLQPFPRCTQRPAR